ncbi:hypothetical protein M0638_27585 [Roseomonas sp. NAR14]|uniref:RecT family protein n=1 Tax=Roseomonas acroporae TaxID=2937791 RepID=A0A9X1YE37_9PROT|nr:recombinase RecT [Roseomonas acroporae]MCK8788122.1 hypothetical protein [Roseomonas acroporae]
MTTQRTVSLAPTTFQEAIRFSEMLANSDMVPKDYKGRPANVMVAIQWGAEVGLSPLQALSNIAIVNGRPSLWGDAALALVRGHPACSGVREGVEGEGEARHGWCEVIRRGEQPQRRTFSVADAKNAGLWGKQGPWSQYPDRMMQLRARGFAIRDVFPDALRGVITTEEAQDIPAEPLPPARGATIDAEPQRASEPRREPIPGGMVEHVQGQQQRRTMRDLIADVEQRLDAVVDAPDLLAVIDDPAVRKLRDTLRQAEPGTAKADAGSALEDRFSALYQRLMTPPVDMADAEMEDVA